MPTAIQSGRTRFLPAMVIARDLTLAKAILLGFYASKSSTRTAT